MTRKEKGIIAATVVAHGLTHVCELVFPATALLVMANFFGESGEYLAMGVGTFVFGLLFGTAALPAGRLVDRFGPRAVLIGLLLASGGSLFALALAPTYSLFIVALALLGFFSGLYHPAGTTMISLQVEEEGRGLGLHGAGGNLGLALTPAVAATLAQAVGWRGAYALLGVLPVLLAVALLLSSVGRDRTPKAACTPGDENCGPLPASRMALALIFLMAIFNGMAYRGLMTFLPSYFALQLHLPALKLDPQVIGGTMTTAILLLGVLGQYLGGSLADRFPKELLYTLIFASSTPLVFLLGRLENLPLLLVTGLFAFLYFMNQPVGNALVSRHSLPEERGRLFGFFFFLGFGTGSIMSPLAGAVGERFQLPAIFALFAGVLLLSTLLGIALLFSVRRR